MKAIILAAGFGKRLQPLTLTIPKALVRIGDKTLIEYNILALRESGIDEIFINLHYLGRQIQEYLGDGNRLGVSIVYSHEEQILETGGAIIKLLPLVANTPFLVLSSDIYTDYNYKNLLNCRPKYAHLVFVPNPGFNERGDFGLKDNKVIDEEPRFTYANIGVFDPQIFTKLKVEPIRLFNILHQYIEQHTITGELFSGNWFNIGTYSELNKCQQWVKKS